MELWIRSQDRETLILTQHLDMYEVASENEKTDRYVIKESETNLGTYKTKERALEVLDEIQTRIVELSALDIIGLPNEQVARTFRKVFEEKNITDLKAVYEMPKE